MRATCLSLLPLFAACSTVADAPPGARTGADLRPTALAATPWSDAAATVPATATEPPRVLGIGKTYTNFTLGTFVPDGDLVRFDDGLYADVTFGRGILPFLAVEGSLGYIGADGAIGSTQLDFWALPLFVNLRASVPIAIFEPFAGAGIGGMYADYQAGSIHSSDFVLAWDAFAGLEVGLSGLSLGVQYKYLLSEETKNDIAVEGSIVSIYLAVGF